MGCIFLLKILNIFLSFLFITACSFTEKENSLATTESDKRLFRCEIIKIEKINGTEIDTSTCEEFFYKGKFSSMLSSSCDKSGKWSEGFFCEVSFDMKACQSSTKGGSSRKWYTGTNWKK